METTTGERTLRMVFRNFPGIRVEFPVILLLLLFLAAPFLVTEGAAPQDQKGKNDQSPLNLTPDLQVEHSVADASIEDLDSVGLAGSSLHDVAPLLVEKDEQNGFTRDLVAVQWRPGDVIYLYVIRPNKIAKPPVVLY